MVKAIVMASGLSSRMGKCKLLLRYESKALVEFVLDAVEDSITERGLKEAVVVTGNEEIKELCDKRSLKVVINEEGYKGQSESIKLGLNALDEALGYMFIAGDQPFLTSEIICSLSKEFLKSPNMILVPIYEGRRGSPVIFPKDYREELLGLMGDNGGRIVLKNHTNKVKYFKLADGKALIDVDTKEDYSRLLNKEYFKRGDD